MGRTFEAAAERASRVLRQSGEPRTRRWRALLIKIIIAVVSAAATSFFGVVLVSQPQVPASVAQEFFDNYYRQVTQVGHREALYQGYLTHEFRESSGSDWQNYSNWWKAWEQVDVKRVESDPGNSLEFNVWLEYYPIHGQAISEEDGFSLVCSTFWAELEARIPALGCPVNHLQIQSQLLVSASAQ